MSNTRHTSYINNMKYFKELQGFPIPIPIKKNVLSTQYMMLTFEEKYMVEREKFRDPKTSCL